MAVLDIYVNTNVAAGKLAVPALAFGDKVVAFKSIVSIAAADDDASVFRLLKNISPDLIPFSIEIWNAGAITGSTDWDLGFYEPKDSVNAGAVIDKDILADGVDLSGAVTRIVPKDGLVTVSAANSQKRIYELLGHTLANKKPGYDLALTANTIGSAAGTLVVQGLLVQG